MKKTNRKHIMQFVEDFRLSIPDADAKHLDTNAQLVRDFTVTALRRARHPLNIHTVFKTVMADMDMEIRMDFFLASLCSKMNESGIVIAGDKVYTL